MLNGQMFAVPEANLKGLDGKPVNSTEIIDPEIATMVVLWGHVKSSDQNDLEKIQSAWLKNLNPEGVKLVVVCAGNIISRSQLEELAIERNWVFDLYFDYYGEFKRGASNSNIPAIMFYGKNQTLICHNHVNCVGKINLICENILENLDSMPEMTVRTYDSAKYQCHTPTPCNSRSW